MHPIAELDKALRPVLSDEVASVHQIFSGPVGGDALLLLDIRRGRHARRSC